MVYYQQLQEGVGEIMAKYSIRHFLPVFTFALVLGLLYKGIGLDNIAEASSGRKVPAFSLGTIEEPTKMVTEEIFKGKVTVLNAWASWCGPCREDHDILMRLAKTGVNIVGLDIKDDLSKARSWLKAKGNPYSVNLFDPKARLAMSLGARATPSLFIIDKQGIIRYKHIGIISDDILENDIKPMIQSLNKP